MSDSGIARVVFALALGQIEIDTAEAALVPDIPVLGV